MKEAFIKKRFQKASRDIIAKANEILEDYSNQGLVLTLRQLYYQFVSKDWLSNTKQSYQRLGGIVSDARLAGLIDWSMMEDRLRSSEGVSTWDDTGDIIHDCASWYHEDLWNTQKHRPEVWIEKDALVGVIESACRDLRVRWMACRGYVSQSAQYESSKRFRRAIRNGQTPIIFHLGDHDPSGIDMTRENREKFALLTGAPVKVERLALNMDQIERYNPPPNPAKETDIRFKGYAKKYGNQSWELDALEPSVIDGLIRKAVTPLIDQKKWKAALEKEEAQRDRIRNVADRWQDVLDFVEG